MISLAGISRSAPTSHDYRLEPSSAGIDMIHVPYRGGAPAMTDLMGGQIQVVFNPVPESMEHIKAGKLRPLAVTGATRSEALPYQDLVQDPDFTRAVKSIAQDCKVNVDIAKLVC
jgi:Tripartite tricarboxylate transporter family receptor